ncbi:hypothetical protein C6503_20815 [Candidatus Poribacteria bacterium]|nr:MAG: hypothetical protein C6503_20815 [Candidatus Poribacteria bacterium]
MKISGYLPIVLLTCIGLAFTTADAQENLAQQAYAVFQQSCLNCHGPSGSFKEALLIDRTALVDTQVVIPGDPENSEFYRRLLGPTENGPQMPLNLPPLSPEAVETIARWITIGAPDWNVQHDINFITTDTILDTIRNHLKSLDPFDRPSARYFTMTHLYNAGETPETLSDYRIALSKLVNSLSWKFEITNPTPIDEAQTIFHIDLRRYEWNTITDIWPQIEQAYPYNIAFDPGTQAGLLEKLTQLQTETGSTVPFVHVDWFLATASLPPLYHDILDLPQTDRILETQLGVNVASNITNAPGIDVWRAGFNDSGVSNHNRVVERHTSRYGAYWKSYDFAGSAGSQNIFTHPLDFTHDGGEIIFNLPNGLQAYLLVDANGNRLNDAPIEIVSNPAANDPTVRNGLSCIGCHTQGMKKFKDSVRAAIEQDDNPPYNKEHAFRLYPEQSVLDDLVAKDTVRFQQALEKIGGPFADDTSRQRFFKRCENEPIQRFHELFQAPLDASHAAAAVGLETEAFLTQIREKQSLKNLGLQTLTDVNGTVKRDAWTFNFDQVISALNTPDSTLPPVVQRPERLPGDGVHIPDPNLRAAIAEALGKGDPTIVSITAEEMATLTSLVANDRGIQDLTGIEFAVNLKHLNLLNNLISDLSPLARLHNLERLDFPNNQVSDLSPLAGLTRLEFLSLTANRISDLSPLAELPNLKEFYSWHNPGISDISPLVGLTVIDICGATIPDLSPLTRATNLKKLYLNACNIPSDLSLLRNLTGLTHLGLGETKISNISPLEGLTNLKWIELRANPISDLSPLRNLTGLIHLNLEETKILSDISPLEELTNLEWLNLAFNAILDISPLEGLTNLKWLNLASNAISDVFSLVELTNLKWLNLDDNKISDFSPLDSLRENITISWLRNPGAPQGGPKIEGPWLWVLVPGERLDSDTDFLAQASSGTVTELLVAANGATEGSSVGSVEEGSPIGSNVWFSHEISPEGGENINDMLHSLGIGMDRDDRNDHVIYGSVVLHSPREQRTKMFVGSNNRVKVWLNGHLIYEWVQSLPGAEDYHDFLPVMLKQGRNVLLVASDHPVGSWRTYFGFEEGTEYIVLNPRVGYTFSEPKIHVGDTFTLDLSTENVFDLAGWQFNIAFDPAVLEAIEVNEGDFLKAQGGTTFFQSGTIDNTAGKITGLSATRLNEDGITGTGTLLSVTFSAKAGGETQLSLSNFQLGSITGEIINAGPHEVIIVIEGQLATGDVNRDGQVNVLDLILVSRHLGKTVPPDSDVDLNGDGVINIQDLIIVAQHLGESTTSAAPSIFPVDDIDGIDPTMIQAWIAQAQIENDGSSAFQQGIANLQQLLTLFIPEETALLHNYPNPFNPETWIPYQLSEPAEVTLRIYAVNGSLIRTLAVGQMPAGIYQTRTRAAYWDGKNDVGEPVASGIYFYTLTAGDFNATRKMLIRK